MWAASCLSCGFAYGGDTYGEAEGKADQHELETGHRVAVVKAQDQP